MEHLTQPLSGTDGETEAQRRKEREGGHRTTTVELDPGVPTIRSDTHVPGEHHLAPFIIRVQPAGWEASSRSHLSEGGGESVIQRLISHPSTNQARPCLALEIRQDRARRELTYDYQRGKGVVG